MKTSIAAALAHLPAAAGARHRFDGMRKDFATRVVFHGPQGGET